ncbi:hypothetical protein [Saccharopolyspora taberi]
MSRDSAASTISRDRAHARCQIENASSGSASSTSNSVNPPVD